MYQSLGRCNFVFRAHFAFPLQKAALPLQRRVDPAPIYLHIYVLVYQRLGRCDLFLWSTLRVSTLEDRSYVYIDVYTYTYICRSIYFFRYVRTYVHCFEVTRVNPIYIRMHICTFKMNLPELGPMQSLSLSTRSISTVEGRLSAAAFQDPRARATFRLNSRCVIVWQRPTA